ncbi:serine protease [Streptomyces sp. LS1784]|uniref:serine protease n=1 Tax=Streptomyces sp. LS1784 TaxID=2851533 RepID=UPI001CCE37BD|nr:serine protease [Streptomyces sp. LS1784]
MTTTSAPRSAPRSVPRRNALRALAVAVALVGTSTPAFGSAAFAAGPETYTLTIKHLDRAGQPAGKYRTHVSGVFEAGGEEFLEQQDASGVTTVRLPKGRYLLDSTLPADQGAGGPAWTDWIVQPRLDLDRDTTVTVDARTTAPVDVRPPDGNARFLQSSMFVEVTHEGVTKSANVGNRSTNLRVGHLGPETEAGAVKQWYDAHWATDTGGYLLGQTFSGTRALTGLTRQYSTQELATLNIRGAAGPGSTGTALLGVLPSNGTVAGAPRVMKTPGTATFLVAPERGTWDIAVTVPGANDAAPTYYSADRIAVRAGTTTTHTFDGPVFGPALTDRPAVSRDGDRITANVPLLADGDGHVPWTPSFDTAYTSLYRDGVLVGAESGAAGRGEFTVPPGKASYRLATTVTRKAATGATARVNASWTFASATTTGPTALPVSVVRFSPELSLTGTAAAGSPLRIPVTVQGAAADGRTRSVTVSASTDGGASWTRLPLEAGAVTVQNPPAGTGVSLRAELTDADGNTLDQTITDAYRTQ